MRIVFKANNPTMSFLGADAAPVPQDPDVTSRAASAGIILAAGGLATAMMAVGAAYFWKSAPKMQGFWKGYGYVSAVLGTVGAVAYGIGTLAGTAAVPFIRR